jgi:hypothetical protein
MREDSTWGSIWIYNKEPKTWKTKNRREKRQREREKKRKEKKRRRDDDGRNACLSCSSSLV